MKKRVLVTGAEGNLGSAVAQYFLQSGDVVVGTYHHHRLQGAWTETPDFIWAQAHLDDPAEVADLAVRGWKGAPFEVLIHCAGGFRFASADQVSLADLEFLMGSNLKSAFLLVRELLPKMKAQNFGNIVFVSSQATLQPGVGLSAYAASKAGLNMLVSSLAAEVRKFKINVNAILPSIIDTPVNRQSMPDADFNSWVLPADLARVVGFLTSPAAECIHGALIPVAGRVE